MSPAGGGGPGRVSTAGGADGVEDPLRGTGRGVGGPPEDGLGREVRGEWKYRGDRSEGVGGGRGGRHRRRRIGATGGGTRRHGARGAAFGTAEEAFKVFS